MTRRFEIVPSIGISRLGDSPDSYMIGPEKANALPLEPDGTTPVRTFRDDNGRMRRQAARFRVFVFDDANPDGRPVDLGADAIKEIRWSVHVANKKAIWYQFDNIVGRGGHYPADAKKRNPQWKTDARRIRAIIDPGPRTLTGAGQKVSFDAASAPGGYAATFPPALHPKSVTTLGNALTKGADELLVLGGHGCSGSEKTPKISSYANNDYWFDDTSDGTVDAEIILESGETLQARGAWVIAAPPKYAPEIPNVITLYDVMTDVAARALGAWPGLFDDGGFNPAFMPAFDRDIQPILAAAGMQDWVAKAPTGTVPPIKDGYVDLSGIPDSAHLMVMDRLGDPDPAYNADRQRIFNILRAADQPQQFLAERHYAMPMLAGNDPFQNDGKDATEPFAVLTPTQYSMLGQWAAGKFTATGPKAGGAAAVTEGVLRNCVGGPFCPGIEMTWISFNAGMYDAPYHIRRAPVTAPLSLGGEPQDGSQPGDLTKRMALPWQADFNECSVQEIALDNAGDLRKAQVLWWPAQRPYRVNVTTAEGGTAIKPWSRGVSDDLAMVTAWAGLGFVTNSDPVVPFYQETERTLKDGD
ncbi:LodA/GoxA family CTQ-dependent oxidase [Yunchengibacter salinarum]|uniref:LodA/GoxA family CTQ-dependent oxidase n=1 Tax=Yunchengibacter salinarum TaxID=3133399 RepID=UPI0035B58461